MLKGTNHNGCRHGYKTETEKKRKKEKKRKTRETIKTLVWAFCKSYKHSLHIQRNLETAENELQKKKKEKKGFWNEKKSCIGYKSLDWDETRDKMKCWHLQQTEEIKNTDGTIISYFFIYFGFHLLTYPGDKIRFW